MSDKVPPPEPAPVVTEQEVTEALQNLLRETTAFTTLNDVVEQLEAKLGGVNLGNKTEFIRTQIQQHFLFLQQQQFQQFQQQCFIPFQQQNQYKDHFALPQTSPNFHPYLNYPSPSQDYAFRSSSVGMDSGALVVRTPGVSVVSPKEIVPTVKKRRGGPGGLNKLCGVSPELQTIVGQPTMPRTEIVRQLWAYIRKHNLQDPNNKRKIICNDELRLLFETDCTDMFKMNKLLAKHIITLEPTKPPAQSAKKAKVDVESGSKIDDPVPIVIISDVLASFFGTNEKEMSQAEVLRQMWEYIKVNQLEDPLNSTTIVCDPKLRELLGCESISALGIPEMLAQRHLSKKS